MAACLRARAAPARPPMAYRGMALDGGGRPGDNSPQQPYYIWALCGKRRDGMRAERWRDGRRWTATVITSHAAAGSPTRKTASTTDVVALLASA